MKKTSIRAISAAACAVLLAACTASNVLDVKNLNNPDVARAYSTPAGIEGIIGTLYQQLNNGVNTTNVQAAGHMLALEGYSTVANFGMNTRIAIPRFPIINDRGNSIDANNLADFSNNQKLARNAANLVQAMDKLPSVQQTTGSPAQDARDRGFAQFVNGAALGYTSLVYDSAAIVNSQVASDAIPPLSGYAAVNAAALALMDSALATAGGSAAAAAFPLPSSWINGNGMSQAAWVQFVHSWKARLRAGVARSPAERAAVKWASVIADASAGITADIKITMGGGWNCAYVSTPTIPVSRHSPTCRFPRDGSNARCATSLVSSSWAIPSPDPWYCTSTGPRIGIPCAPTPGPSPRWTPTQVHFPSPK